MQLFDMGLVSDKSVELYESFVINLGAFKWVEIMKKIA